MLSTDDLLYAEDLRPGLRMDLGSRRLSEEEIVTFAAAWDPLPFHLDADGSAQTPFGGIVATGLHAFAVAVRMMSDGMSRNAAIVAGRGMREIEMRKPVRPGMALHGSLEVEATDIRGDGTAVSRWLVQLHDDDGGLVLTTVMEAKVRCRANAE